MSRIENISNNLLAKKYRRDRQKSLGFSVERQNLLFFGRYLLLLHANAAHFVLADKLLATFAIVFCWKIFANASNSGPISNVLHPDLPKSRTLQNARRSCRRRHGKKKKKKKKKKRKTDKAETQLIKFAALLVT